MTGDELVAKIRTAEARVRKAVEARKLSAAETKAKKDAIDEAQEMLFATIRDDPEGDLGFRDEGGPG